MRLHNTPKIFVILVFCTVWLLPIIKWNTRTCQSVCVLGWSSSESLRMHCRRSCLHFAYFNRALCGWHGAPVECCTLGQRCSASSVCVRRVLLEPLQWPEHRSGSPTLEPNRGGEHCSPYGGEFAIELSIRSARYILAAVHDTPWRHWL